ncbi:P-loop containing nucleoside triphosphate hydrolase protein [Dendrothele bispora CBS 962.96]|uniref:P-loop containing nucleoside triphosphate hydrolase protein n=1 Tax=Dendrothele bispora (strain CBS 962.96) TaxID=1314807 RepID=A0A4S8M7H8_DENBC|nr:P-loop containing nucleoside triphosphate hydrolase protein [Dendrothele bispora CBS 962.96]
MDLDDFNINPLKKQKPKVPNFQSFQDALGYLDETWTTELGRKARWMDLIGDFAGTEPFVVDGESLLQLVLDDPLLALGRTDDPSFQVLHAYHIVERFLRDLISRSASFDIVFWRANRYNTLRTGDAKSIVASRALARVLLFRHLSKLSETQEFMLKVFNDLEDPCWAEYERSVKPMFVIMSNGGPVPRNAASPVFARILLRREFVRDLLSRGLPMVSLEELEFRDSKILSFVHEVESDFRPDLSKIYLMAKHKRAAFDEELATYFPGVDSLYEDRPTCDARTAIRSIAKALVNAQLEPNLPLDLAEPLTYLFLLHILLLDTLPLRLRARNVASLHPNLRFIVLDQFLPMTYIAMTGALVKENGALDVDGRIFVSLIQYACMHADSTIPEEFGDKVPINQIWMELKGCLPHFEAFASFHQSAQPVNSLYTPAASELSFPLLPFSNPVLDKHLSSLQIILDHGEESTEDFKPNGFSGSTIFADTTHWHNPKALLAPHLGGEKPQALTKWQQQRRLRYEQRFMSTIQKQAVTLTGASGKVLERVVIPLVGSRPAPIQSHSSQANKPEKVPKAPKLNSAGRLRQKIKEEKELKSNDSSSKWWQDQLSLLGKKDLLEQIKHLATLNSNPRASEDQTGTEMRLYRLHLELMSWTAEPKRDSATIHDRYSLSVLQMVKDISDRKYITSTTSDVLSSVLRALGFDDYLSMAASTVSKDYPLAFSFVKLFRSKGPPKHDWMKIRDHPVQWQLRLFGEFMDRSMDSTPDPRVSFEPDAWQRRVLDCIDKKSSLLVVAPTSAGKTFISFYAMEQVLRGSDEGIFVYVAPTKALVMQIALEVYARFSKNLKGKTCWAVHTRDYRVHNPQNCQILITVPEVLSIMLLSPSLAKHWTPKLKWICLDEIHCIGQQEGGTVWEQLILMAPCPIIGLSATVGDPLGFSNWLRSVQTAHGYDYEFVQHPHRYSHLRKFFYLLRGEEDEVQPFTDLSSHQETGRLSFLHPVTTLTFGARSLPADLALEARDTLTLFNALKKIFKGNLEHLDPVTFFSSTGKLLTQKEVLRYESSLRETVSTLAASSDRLDSESLLRRIIKELQDVELSKASIKDLNTVPTPRLFLQNLIYLLADLNAAGELPAILFSFDRSGCEIMAKHLTKTLIEAEKKWRSESSEWNRKMEEWEKWEEGKKHRERAAAKLAKQRKNEPPSEDPTWHSSFDPRDPSDQFSFANHHAYSKQELNEDIQELTSFAPPWALAALKRGIAVHHAGMNKRYRGLVEGLFRRGFLRVVIATGTLALGINAPAKTSVFCGDSPFLTALMYRQCAGRAGRRGFDLLGKVVFYGLSMDRVQRLVLSRLPSLKGNFPLTSTLSLRLFNLLHGSDYAEVTTRTVDSIMSLSQISLSSDIGQQQLLHHLRFSIEYLRRARLLDEQGRPMNLFAVAAHLYYTEPSNLALVALMRNGILHQISEKNDIDAKKELILLLSHLFGRRYLSKTFANEEYMEALRKQYPSVIILPPLDTEARRVLVEHEQQTLRIYSEYAKAYTNQYLDELGEDRHLPLSRLDYSGSSNTDCLPSNFRSYLKCTANQFMTRSAFVATSGHVDVFNTVQELTSTVREGLHLRQHAVPSFAELVAEGDEGKTLNAYIFDFYMHGQTSTLAQANGIRRGEVWYLLQEFSLTLLVLKTGLEQLLMKISMTAVDEEGGDVYDTADYAEADHDEDEDEKAEGFACPKGVSKVDWRVYELVKNVSAEFDEKYRAMWA